MKLSEYESRLRDYGTELERVNGKLKSKTDEQIAYENKIKSLVQELETLRRGQGEI